MKTINEIFKSQEPAKTEQVQIRLDKSRKAYWQQIADQQGVSLSKLITAIMDDCLQYKR